MSTPPLLYDPDGVATLSEAAQASADLSALAYLAETLLSLRGTALTGDDAETARLAVGMQVSFMVEQGVASRLYATFTEGERRYEFADAAQAGVDPVAARLVAPLLAPPAVMPDVLPRVLKTF